MTLFWRSWTLVVLLITAVMAVLVLLSTVQFSAILTNLVQGRLAVLVYATQSSLKSATGLGLSLSHVRNGAAILERAKRTDPLIVAIHVFDNDGRILLSTDAHPPANIVSRAFESHAASHNLVWRSETDGFLLSGASIMAPLQGRPLGGVVIVYPKSGLEVAVKAMGASLALMAAGVTLLIACLAVVVLRYGLRHLMSQFNGIEKTLAAIEKAKWRQAAAGAYPLPPRVVGFGIDTGVLIDHLHSAEAQYVSAGMELAVLERPGKAA